MSSRLLRSMAVIVVLLFVALYIRTINASADSSLIAAYNFNELNGDTVIDQSGYGNTAITSGGVNYVPDGKYGGALQFSGSNGLATVADSASLDLTNAMTLEAWINPSTLSGWRTADLKAANDHLAYGLYANTHLNIPHAEINSGSSVFTTEGLSQLSLNTWSHIAVTYDKYYLKLYVNGTFVAQKYMTNAIQITSGKLFIGGNTVWGEYFKGLIDDVRIYNKILNQSEIQTDMNTPIN